MDGVRLILADGTIFEGGSAGLSRAGSLWLYISGDSMAELAGIFCDAAKTAVIVFEYGEMRDLYEGYTDCRMISIGDDGRTTVGMRKAAAAAEAEA